MSGDEDRRRDRVRGCMLGAAMGSALGLPLEGVPVTARDPTAAFSFGPHTGATCGISADAQLMMFTAEGLIRAAVRHSDRGICHPPSVVHQAYLRWLTTQGITGKKKPIDGADTGWLFSVKDLHHRRGPGEGTIKALKRGEVFTASRPPNTSKGNGALTRIAPVGLMAERPFELAIEIAVLTHGHATGYLAPAFFASTLHELLEGRSVEAAVAHARRSVEEHRQCDEVLVAVDRAAAAATAVRVGADPRAVVRTLGHGQTADEALQIALFCIYVSRGVRDALSLSVAHDGDTDATASLVGAALGAAGGVTGLPVDWLAVLELRAEIETLADDLFRATRENLERGDWSMKYPGC